MSKNKFIKWGLMLIATFVLLLCLSLLKIIGIPEKCYATGDIGHCNNIFSPKYWQDNNPGMWYQIHYLRI